MLYVEKSHIKALYIKKSTPTWKDELHLPEGSYSVSDIQDYLEHMIWKYETLTDDNVPMIYIYIL